MSVFCIFPCDSVFLSLLLTSPAAGAESTSDIDDTRWFCCVLDSETVLRSQPFHLIPAACDGMGVALGSR